MSVTFDSTKKEIYIEDIGVTMRTLLAVAARGYGESQVRKWHIVYKGARIGLVQVKTTKALEVESIQKVDTHQPFMELNELIKSSGENPMASLSERFTDEELVRILSDERLIALMTDTNTDETSYALAVGENWRRMTEKRQKSPSS